MHKFFDLEENSFVCRFKRVQAQIRIHTEKALDSKKYANKYCNLLLMYKILSSEHINKNNFIDDCFFFDFEKSHFDYVKESLLRLDDYAVTKSLKESMRDNIKSLIDFSFKTITQHDFNKIEAANNV